MKRWIDASFVAAVLAVLIIGLVKTVCFPKDLNTYENRYAVKLNTPTLSEYAEGKLQDNMEDALNDQILFAQTGKSLYHMTNSVLLNSFLSHWYPAQRYVHVGYQLRFDHNICYSTRKLSDMQEKLDEKISGYNRLFQSFPDTEFYLYYIEKDTDIDFETGNKVGSYEYLKDRLDLPDDRVSCFRIDSFDDFSEQFFRTDHHWNCRGSYRAYIELLSLLGCSDEPISHSEEITLGTFSGSKAIDKFASSQEEFFAYRYDMPEFAVTINGEAADDYGAQESFLNGSSAPISYAAFYGNDVGELVLDTGRETRGNLLILGESYDNALIKLLASHYDKTFGVDLRYYTNYMGEDFSLKDYLSEHDISKVLLIGNIDYFTMPEFLPGE